MSKLDAALEAVRRGFSVFPLRPNAKIPAIKNWRNLATPDHAQIRAWWTENPDYNIGGTTSDKFVADMDPRNGGVDTLAALRLQHEFPKTARTQTAGGGAHMIYALPEHTIVKGGAHKLGPGLDVKSWGGLIVLPGSRIDGTPYEWKNDSPLTVVPEWMLLTCKRARAKTGASGKRLIEEDDKAVEAAEQWLAYESPDIWEGKRDDTGFIVACKLFEFAVSLATCEALLSEWNYTHCHPPLDDADIHRLANSADTGMENAKGIKHPDYTPFTAEQIASSATAAAIRLTGEKPKGLYFLTFKDAAHRALTHGAEPLVDGLLDCETMSVVYGESNSGKSFTEMDKDFRISIGEPVAGRAVKQGAVVWIAAEGGSGVYKRLAALKLHYKRDDAPFFIVPCPIDLRRPDADVKPLIALIKQVEAESGLKVVKVTIDTLSRVMAGGDENSPVDMGLLVHHFDAIRYVTKAHVAIIHHTGKDKAKGARGHSLLRAATDTEIEVGARTITVTKQRDLEGDIKMHFGLVVVRIGTDMRGKEVTSCYVAIGAKGAVQFDVPATTAERELMQDIERALLTAECPEFGWEFVVDNCPKRGKTDSDKDSDKKRARSTVVEHLSGLSDKGYLEKLFDNQYVTGCRSLSESTKT